MAAMSGRIGSAVHRLSTTLRRPWGGARGPDEPPVVSGWVPFLGCALPFGRDAPAFLRRCRDRHGDAFSLFLLGRRMTFLLDPRDYPVVFKQAHALRFGPIAKEISTRAFGYESFYRDEHLAEQLRETYARHLRPGAMAPLAERTRQELARTLAERIAAQPVGPDGWRELDLYDLVSRSVFEAGVIAMFGRGPVDAAMHDAFARFDHQFARLVGGVPPRLLGTVRQDRDALVQRLRPPWPDASAFIEERREILARHVDDLEAARVRLSMLWASQANTIPAAFWAVALLLEHPPAHAAIRAEVDEVIARDDHGRPKFDAAQRKEQPRLDAAILEVLLLCAGGTTIRSVIEPLSLELHDGRRCALRPGDNVALFPYLSHRDPQIFANPEAFLHDRFLPTERGARQFHKDGQRLGFALMPFGGGESMCPGRFLAQSEMRGLVTLLMADWDLELAPGQRRPALDLSRSGLGILPPTGSLRVRLRPRAA